MPRFEKILESIEINGMRLKNRMVASPVTTNFAAEDGKVTERLVNFYRERARGGVGLVIVEGSFIRPECKGYVRQLGIHDDKLIPSLKRLTDVIHEGGSVASIQIQHVGRRTSSKITGFRPKAPSPIACYPGGEVPEELTSAGIKQIVESHVAAALRVRKSGFDCIDIHAAHGYLIPAFFSPLSNMRTDDYGGSLENRVRIAVEIIQGIKAAVGKDFPITMKISGDEYAEGGLTLEDMLRLVPLLEGAGLDAVTVSAGTVTAQEADLDSECPHKFVRTLPMGTREACFSYLAAAIKEKVTIPVMAVGRINTPFVAEKTLQEGKADLVGLARGLLADPDFARKTLEGRPEDVRPCIACNQGCFGRLFVQKDISCTVNPTIGHEGEYQIERGAKAKSIWVVGGGPAGMEAARIASLRGNAVTLFEKMGELGGQLLLAAILPDRNEFKRIIDHEKHILEKQAVTVRLNTPVDKAKILEERPDTIVFATGAEPLEPPIKGVSGKNVGYAWDVLKGHDIDGDRIVVVGGGLVGCETAEYLTLKGKQVVLIEMLEEIAIDAIGDNRKFLMAKLDKLGVEIRTETVAKEILDTGLLCVVQGNEKFIEGEYIVLALGAKPVRQMIQSLDIRSGHVEAGDHRIKVLEAGDCVSVRTALEAFAEGFKAGLNT